MKKLNFEQLICYLLTIYNIDDMSKMSFTPLLGNSIKEKDKRIFNDGKMGIRDEVMQQTLKT